MRRIMLEREVKYKIGNENRCKKRKSVRKAK
jgi:hypothetical protein